jgi:hypothetical protein
MACSSQNEERAAARAVPHPISLCHENTGYSLQVNGFVFVDIPGHNYRNINILSKTQQYDIYSSRQIVPIIHKYMAI